MKKSYSAFVLVSRLQSELNRLFKEAMAIPEPGGDVGEWQPEIDVVESATTIRVLVEVPGLDAGDLHVEVLGSVLRIAGNKRVETPKAPGPRFHRIEREHGRFSRDLRLLWPLNSHQGRARLADGLLTVEFPKIEDQRQRGRAVVIEVEEERKE